LEAGAREFAGRVPLILKLSNHDVLLEERDPAQALTGSVGDAVRLGCVGIGFTIYPGSEHRLTMYGQLRGLAEEAEAHGLAERVTRMVQAAFDGRWLVTVSGGAADTDEAVFEQVRAIRDGGGFGSIIGRNSFQRRKPDALRFLKTVMDIYAGAKK